MAHMVISDDAWTIHGLGDHWTSQEWGAMIAKAAADMQYAWLLGEIGRRLPGWDYDGIAGQFSGPAQPGAHEVVADLITESQARITGS